MNEEMLTTEIMEAISFYQPSLQDSVINFTGLKNRLKKSVLKFDIEAFDEGKYRAEICKILYFFYGLEVFLPILWFRIYIIPLNIQEGRIIMIHVKSILTAVGLFAAKVVIGYLEKRKNKPLA